MPAAIYPMHFDRRTSSQRSCFSIHGSARDGFNLLPTVAKDRLAKVIIPGLAAREIDHSLSIAGVDEIKIFPDLDGTVSMRALWLPLSVSVLEPMSAAVHVICQRVDRARRASHLIWRNARSNKGGTGLQINAGLVQSSEKLHSIFCLIC